MQNYFRSIFMGTAFVMGISILALLGRIVMDEIQGCESRLLALERMCVPASLFLVLLTILTALPFGIIIGIRTFRKQSWKNVFLYFFISLIVVYIGFAILVISVS